MCVEQKYTRRQTKNMNNPQKEVQTKLTKGLLDLIVLQLLRNKPMHGYQIITSIRKSFGVYFGPSTIYPMLSTLEKKGQVKSEWNMNNERPRKVYELTSQGKNILDFTENSLNLICQKIGNDATPSFEVSATINNAKPNIYQKRSALAHATVNLLNL
jgi:PadR family transcriptional regulator PadR